MSSFTPINIPVRDRSVQARLPSSTVVQHVPGADDRSQPNMESGPGPPVDSQAELQTPQWPPSPQMSGIPPLPELPPLPQMLQMPQSPRSPRVPQAAEVIDLTGLSDDEDENDWEDVPEIIDLTNLPSDDEDDDAQNDQEQARVPEQYTILNLPPRRQYTLTDTPAKPGRRLGRHTAHLLFPNLPVSRAYTARVAASREPIPRVPVRRDICELCNRIVRWGPGCFITKHHLYPQQITKKYPDRFTEDQKKSIALLCRPCHDACHKAHTNRILADFYYQVELLKADPEIQAHVREMQRASTPELIAEHGDGIHVRRRKQRLRAARAARNDPPKVLTRRQLKLLAKDPSRQPSERALHGPQPPKRQLPHPDSLRRSARLLAKGMGHPQVPAIVIEDKDEQDAVIHEYPQGKKDENMLDAVSREELAALEAGGEYIPL
ncbi:proline-specific permease [Diaporthe amygdali]|uniref:proline-specific permease n=1 Tax=Phomopsis amygdali TaxID=1214568 RepID=UPI0022FE250E|nr:proline-specific permease [Diaporthe amygdali]KAJ0119707.1 proline-specific permease [Diaporthe amygdali]